MLNTDLKKVKVAGGSRYTCPFYVIKNPGLQPNKKGAKEDAIPTDIYTVLENMQKGVYYRECKQKLDKFIYYHPDDKRSMKYYALSIYAFKDHRYTVEEKTKDENGKIIESIRTDYAFNEWTGFQGYDFDPDKAKFNDEQLREIGLTLKRLIHEELNGKVQWYISSQLSTGAHGTHTMTAIELPPFFDDLSLEEKIRFHHFNFWYNLWYIMPALCRLPEEIPYVTMDDVIDMTDTAMLKVTQTLNITPFDEHPYINDCFKYERSYEMEHKYNECNVDYIKFNDSELLMLPIETQNLYSIYLKICFDNRKDSSLSHFRKPISDIDFIFNPFSVSCLDSTKSKGPFHFQHKRPNGNTFWTGNQIFHTLMHFMSREEIIEVWKDPKFYDLDPAGRGVYGPYDWIRYCETVSFDENVPPNFKLVNWLNTHCGFNLKIDYIKKDEEYDNVINLKDDEYIGDYEKQLFDMIKPGINLIDAWTGTGKTTLFQNIAKRLYKEEQGINYVFDDEPKTTYILHEPYKSVLNGKFGQLEKEGIVDIVVGSKKLANIDDTRNNFLCSSYYQINRISDEDIAKVDYLVVDESHLMFLEAFRENTIVEFVNQLNKFKCVILMTGTPVFEQEYFKMLNYIKINKKDKRTIRHEYVRFTPDIDNQYFNITHVSTLARNLIRDGRKVFIYNKSISLQNCKRFQYCNPDLKVAIYHKRHADEESNTDDMRYIDTEHRLGDKFDVIISSCFFSVGNDLYDDCKAAVIMCGNHIWQETIQVIGRWRNSEDISVYTVLKDRYEEQIQDEVDVKKVYNYKFNIFKYQYNDLLERTHSIVVKNHTFRNISLADVDFLAYVAIADNVNLPIKYKDNKLQQFDIICEDIDRIFPLSINYDCLIQNSEFSLALKNIRDDTRRNFLDALINDKTLEWTNNDNKLNEWERCVYAAWHLIDAETFKNNLPYFSAFNIDGIQMFNRMLRKIREEDIDYSEIYSIIETSKLLLKEDHYINSWISFNNFQIIKGYVLWYHYVNKDEVKHSPMQADYFQKYKKAVIDYNNINDNLKEYLYNETKGKFPDFMDEAGHIYSPDKIPFDEYKKQIRRNKLLSKGSEKELFENLLSRFLENNKANNQNANKICVVTNKFKCPERYELHVGQKFESVNEMSKHTRKSIQTISKWRKKGWIE